MNTATSQQDSPPRRRRTVIPAALGTIALAAVALTACAPAAPHPAATFTPAPPASFTPAPPAPASAMSTWCAGPGWADLQAVNADLGQIRAGTGSGSTLTADAEAAEQLPPPVTRAQKVSYTEALGALSFAGIDLDSGNAAAALTAMHAAGTYLSQDQGILSC